MTLKSTIISLLILLSLSTTLFAMDQKNYFRDKEVENIIVGIKSDNNGLMRSSIYFAGKYKIEETVDALFEVLDEESEPSNVILIAFSIYEIGDTNALMKLIETANNSESASVKNMLIAIATQYLSESKIHFVLR